MKRNAKRVFNRLLLPPLVKNKLKAMYYNRQKRCPEDLAKESNVKIQAPESNAQTKPKYSIGRTVNTSFADLIPGLYRKRDSGALSSSPAQHTGGGSPGMPHMRVFRSFSEYRKSKSEREKLQQSRIKFECTFLPADEETFDIRGYCSVCQSPKSFSADYLYAYQRDENDRLIPNWRETLVCESCGMNNRVRAAVDLLMNQMAVNLDDHFYVTEQLTPFYSWMKGVFPNVTGSEYLGEDKAAGVTYGDLRHEDITRLSFDDDSLDCILSFDVLEHVPDTASALSEFVRCLKPGGFALISAPFASNQNETIVRARLTEKGRVEHLMEPEYHGNPTRPDEGSLCFYHFGWDLLNQLKSAGASEAAVLSYYSSERANLGPEQLYFVALK